MARAWAWLLLPLAALCAHAAAYHPFLSDDALISLRYADRLLEGHGLTWTDGPRVEGYSNLLWVLACAGLGALGIDLIDAARALGVAGFAAAVVAVGSFAARDSGRDRLPLLAACGALAASGSVAVWSVGGLEQPLGAALLALALALLLGRGREGLFAASVPLALLCWTRPDGPLFAVSLAVAWWLGHGARRRALGEAALLCALPALAVLTQLGFRLAYYEAWLPNTAHIKLGLSWRRLLEGAHYLGLGLLWASPFLLPTAALSIAAARRRPETRLALWLLGVPLLAWCAYLVSVGGDIFPGRRHLVPVLVIAAFALAVSLRALAWRGLAVRLATAALLALFLAVQSFDPENRRAHTERWEWEGEVIGRLLARAFADEQPLLAVDPAGTLPYFSRLPAIDMLGLNDRTIATTPLLEAEGPVGHGRGNGAYVLDREPDLILFCLPAGRAQPCFRSGYEAMLDERFPAHYRLARFLGREPFEFRSQVWVRAENGRIGIERSGGRVGVPAHLLTALPGSAAHLDAEGRLVVDVDPKLPAAIGGLALEPGRWKLVIRADGAIEAGVRRSEDRSLLARGGAELDFELAGGRVDVLVAPAEGEARAVVRGLELVRLD